MPESTKPRRQYAGPREKRVPEWDQAILIQGECRNALREVATIGSLIRSKMESGEEYDRPRLTQLAKMILDDIESFKKELEVIDGKLANRSGKFKNTDDLAEGLDIAMTYSNWMDRWSSVVIPAYTEIMFLCKPQTQEVSA